ncbi:hypothetical protein niasHT_032752 [Heterodera trifolii]|uniref:Uncharacterized protein n=1 Tax=Heterodera trifolii TaxID=157864 RepID=A0ABD2IGR2_9BILA
MITIFNVWQSLLQWGTRTLQRISGTFCSSNSSHIRIGYGTLKIKFKARTSGTAFVVGIGSIMAYKLLCRLAKSNCLWSSIDQLIEQRSSLVALSTDGGCSADTAAGDDPSPSSSPSRTVQLTDGFYAVRLGGENELLRKLDECFCRKDSGGGGGSSTASSSASVGNAPPGEQLAVVQVRHGRNLRRLIRQNQRVQREGIEALQLHDHYEQQQKHGPTRGVLLRAEEQQQRMSREDEDNESVISDISNLTSASRIPPNPNAVERVPPLQLPPDDDGDARDGRRASAASAAASSTPISALLHCPNAEDELCWENEFSSASEAGDDDAPPHGRPTQSGDEIMGGSDTEGLFLFRERCTSLGSLSQLSAMKNLERMFRGMAPTDWHGDGEETTNWAIGDECHGTEHRLVDSALDNLRELDRLDVNTNVSSSMVSNSGGGGRLARRCWLDMEGGAGGTRGPGSAAYRIAGSKSDLDISEMSSSSICSRPQMIAIQRNHHKQLSPHSHHHHQHKSHGLWELTSLNFLSTPVVDNDDKQHLGGNNNPAFYSRFTHEKRNAKAAKAVSAPMPAKQNNDAEQGKVNDDGLVAVQQQHSADDTTDDGWEEDGIFAQCQKSPPCQQQQSSLLLTPAATSSSSTMVDSVISCHSSLASTSVFSTQQRCSISAEMLTSGAGGVMFDSAIVSDGGAPSNLGFFGHEHDEHQQKEEEGLEEVKNNESFAPPDVSTPRRF